MKSTALGLRTAGILFAAFALGHLVRIIAHAKIVVAEFNVPLWPSVVVAIAAGGLAIWLLRLSADAEKTPAG